MKAFYRRHILQPFMKVSCWIGWALLFTIAWAEVLVPFVQLFRSLTAH